MSAPEKRFPMQVDRHDSASDWRSIPWGVAEIAYREYAKQFGRSQSLERLAERGGFGWAEFGWLMARYFERRPEALPPESLP